MNIVLIHGVLGAHIFGLRPYFNGVKPHLEEKFGADVLESHAAPIGSVKTRSEQLRDQIVKHHWKAPKEKLILIAHSMGGLDARQMLTDHPDMVDRVRSLTCIATPHHGSPVASELEKLFGFVGAVEDLSKDGATKIDAACPDKPQIRYREVVTVGRDDKQRTAHFFDLFSKVMTEESDGVVPSSSALPENRTLLERVQCDHADVVGHDADDFPFFRPRKYDHLPLYERIVKDAAGG